MSRVARYPEQAGLELSAASLQQAVTVLEAALAQPAAPRSEDELYSYRVPKLGEGGSCSLVDELEEQPYELSPWLGGRSAEAGKTLRQLDALVQAALRLVVADWLGVYCRFQRHGEARLVKLAYRGLPSRAEFPLTEDFALFSNNSRVGLRGKAAVIADVQAWQQPAAPTMNATRRCRARFACRYWMPMAGCWVFWMQKMPGPDFLMNTSKPYWRHWRWPWLSPLPGLRPTLLKISDKTCKSLRFVGKAALATMLWLSSIWISGADFESKR